MNRELINTLQNYLTMGEKKLLDIEALSKRHPLDKILKLLESLMKDKKEDLKDLIALNISDSEMDRAVCEWFRVQLVVNILREEVTDEATETEQGTETCGRSA